MCVTSLRGCLTGPVVPLELAGFADLALPIEASSSNNGATAKPAFILKFESVHGLKLCARMFMDHSERKIPI